MDECALIASAARGDVESLNRLVHRHQDAAYNVACRLLGHRQAAADATQEAVLAAYRALPALRGESFRAWLLRMVVDACRRRARPEQSCLPAWPGDPAGDGGSASAPGCHGRPQDTPLERAEAGIARLPLEQRVVLVLADVQGLSYEEVARVTGASPAVVGRRLGDARARLRDWLRDDGSGTWCATGASSL